MTVLMVESPRYATATGHTIFTTACVLPGSIPHDIAPRYRPSRASLRALRAAPSITELVMLLGRAASQSSGEPQSTQGCPFTFTAPSITELVMLPRPAPRRRTAHAHHRARAALRLDIGLAAPCRTRDSTNNARIHQQREPPRPAPRRRTAHAHHRARAAPRRGACPCGRPRPASRSTARPACTTAVVKPRWYNRSAHGHHTSPQEAPATPAHICRPRSRAQ